MSKELTTYSDFFYNIWNEVGSDDKTVCYTELTGLSHSKEPEPEDELLTFL